MYAGTYSIVARCKKTGDFGVASATAAPCVGAFLPFVQEGVGAIATQAWVNVNLGYHGLMLMRLGLSAKATLEALLADDKGRARRQVIAVDPTSVFGYTGEECTGAKGHVLGDDFAVAGNILSSAKVLQDMAEVFKGSKGELGGRLISALEAGQAAGGDHRGKTSSVLLIASSKPMLFHNIRVDMHREPVKELRRIYIECLRTQEEYDEANELSEVLRLKVLRVHK